jgi:hypothetical protein
MLMPVISGFGGQVAEPTPARRGADLVAPLAELLADSTFLPEEPPAPRPWSPQVSSFSLAGLLDRPPLYAALDRLDPALAERWRTHEEQQVEPLRAVVLALEQLDGDERQERREHDRLMHKALTEGKAPPRLKVTDWTARRAQLESEQRSRLELARESYRAYAEAAKAAMPEILQRTAPKIMPQRAEALKAAQAAERQLRSWRSMVWICDEIARRLDPEGERLDGRMSGHARELLAEGMRALPAVSELLGSEDPVLSGARHVEHTDVEQA